MSLQKSKRPLADSLAAKGLDIFPTHRIAWLYCDRIDDDGGPLFHTEVSTPLNKL